MKKCFSKFDKALSYTGVTLFGMVAIWISIKEGIAGPIILFKMFLIVLSIMLIACLSGGIVYLVFAYCKRRYDAWYTRKAFREMFGSADIEYPVKKKEGIHMECPGPNKFAR